MRRLLLSMLLCLLYSQAFSQLQFFHAKNLEEAKKEAQRQNKLIFVDVYTDWCGPCKMMQKEVFPDKAVGDLFNANFVSIKVDGDPGRGWEDFVATYQIQGFPTLIVMNSDGEMLYRSEGMLDVQQMLDWGKNASNPQNHIPLLREKYNKMMQEYAQKANDAAFRKDFWKTGLKLGLYRKYTPE